MEPIQIIIIIFAAFAISRVVLRAREKKLDRKQFIFWIVVWAAAITFAIIPGLLTSFAGLAGIQRGIDTLVYLGIITLFYFSFKMYVKLKGIEEKMTKIIRETAIKNEGKRRKKGR